MGLMNPIIKDYLDNITDDSRTQPLEKILTTIETAFPELELVIKWNQPMFIHHGTFIIAISHSKKHISIAPERYALDMFEETFTQMGYSRTKEYLLYPWNQPMDLELIKKIVAFNIEDKKEMTRFWR